MDAALELLATWSPPPIDNRTKADIALAAVRAGALRQGAEGAGDGAAAQGPPALDPARQARGHPPLQPVQRVLLAVPRRVDDLLVRDLLARGDDAGGGAETKLELVCTKLALQPGMRVLDVGCGWGSFAIHAAREHGVHVTGITLSEPQAALARERAAAAGVADRVDIRVMDYREITGETFDAIASIGMVEHVGNVNIDAYSAKLAALLKPGGRLLNHGIARLRVGDAGGRPVLRALRVPGRRAAAPLADLAVDRARRAARPPRRGLPGRLLAHAATSGGSASRPTSTGRGSSAATSACASGGSTCACPSAASTAASSPSTRCGRDKPLATALRRAAPCRP